LDDRGRCECTYCLTDSIADAGIDETFPLQANLEFRWMDVYIDFRRRDVNLHRSERVPTRWKQRVVRLFNRVGKRLASYDPTIHDKGGVGPGVSVDNGRSADTGDANRGLVN